MDQKNPLYRKTGGLTKVGEEKLVEELSKEIRFSPKEIKRLILIYKQYLKDTWYMDAATFSQFLHNSFGFNEDFFMNRIFLAADINKDNRIDMEEFIRMIAIMLRGSRPDKIGFCFKCYDLSENNELTRDDIIALLIEGIRESPYKEVNSDVIRDLVEMVISRMDKDRDGIISFEEFKNTALEDWLFTESFGQCLPDDRYRASFLFLLETESIESPEEVEVEVEKDE